METAPPSSAAPRSRDDDGASAGYSTSDSEYTQALEIILDPAASHRRKSSMVRDEIDQISTKRTMQREKTACHVHQILEAERRARKAKGHRGDAALSKVSEKPAEWQNGNIRRKADEQVEVTVRSRMLTKRQLSDMTWGVRELSKKLGSIRLRLNVKTVFILTKIYDEELVGKSRELVEWLLSKDRDTPYIVYIEDRFERSKSFDAKELLQKNPSYEGRLKYWTEELCQKHPQTFDLAITLGGDGTILYASSLFQRIVPPVLAFSLGSLGFLTKFDFGNYEEILTKAFREGVVVSLRLRFEGTVMRSQTRDSERQRDLVEELIGEESEDERTHKPDATTEILNDVVVDRGPNATMSTIELFGDDEHFTTVQADGMCVATPTGSTAYNLAAGGSLSHPDNPIILVTAIAPHTLSFRPIILPDTIVLRLGVPYDARASAWASFDGRDRVELKPGDYVTVSASRYPFPNVMPEGRRSEDWVQSISRTLNWNSRERQKAFKIPGDAKIG